MPSFTLFPASGKLGITPLTVDYEAACAWVSKVVVDAALAASTPYLIAGILGTGAQDSTTPPDTGLGYTDVTFTSSPTIEDGIITAVKFRGAWVFNVGAFVGYHGHLTLSVLFQNPVTTYVQIDAAITGDPDSGGVQEIDLGSTYAGAFIGSEITGPIGYTGPIAGWGTGFAENWTAVSIDYMALQIDYGVVKVNSISPSNGAVEGGTPVTITGEGFLGFGVNTVNTVYFGVANVDDPATFGNTPQPAIDVVVVDDHTITCQTPPFADLTAPPGVAVGVLVLFGAVATTSPAFLRNELYSYGAAPSQWCYNPTSNHYVYAVECPGPPFISGVDPPTIAVTGIEPRSSRGETAALMVRAIPRRRSVHVLPAIPAPRAVVSRAAPRSTTTHTLKTIAFDSAPTFQGTALSAYGTYSSGGGTQVNTDPTVVLPDLPDGGTCLHDLTDGKDVTKTYTAGGFMSGMQMAVYFEDDGVIPLDAVINSVQVVANVKGTNAHTIKQLFLSGAFYSNSTVGAATAVDTHTPQSSSYALVSGDVLTENANTHAPWQRAELFNDNDAGGEGNGGLTLFCGEDVFSSTIGDSYGIDYIALIVNYDYVPPPPSGMWCYNPYSNRYLYAAECPGPPWISDVDPPTVNVTSVSPRSG